MHPVWCRSSIAHILDFCCCTLYDAAATLSILLENNGILLLHPVWCRSGTETYCCYTLYGVAAKEFTKINILGTTRNTIKGEKMKRKILKIFHNHFPQYFKAILLIALTFIDGSRSRGTSHRKARRSAPCRPGGRAGCPCDGQNPPGSRCRLNARICCRR